MSILTGGLQVGGGINETNAQEWLDAGASKVRPHIPASSTRRGLTTSDPPPPQVIVTSYLFPSASFSLSRLQNLAKLVGKERLVVDVSCRKREGGWWVAMDKWTRITDLEVTKGSSWVTPNVQKDGLLTVFFSFQLVETLDTLSEYCRFVQTPLLLNLW